MKRTNLVLDEEKLNLVTHLLAAKTYSQAVNTALDQVIKFYNIKKLAEVSGTPGTWSGSLEEMRNDIAKLGSK